MDDVGSRTIQREGLPFASNEPVIAGRWAALEPGDVIRDRFKVVKLLGEGGMSHVYLAEDMRRAEAADQDTKVAIKLLRRELAEHRDSFAILQREARRMQRLAHPNIVQVYDFDVFDGMPYLVMEYVVGTLLSEHLLKSRSGMPMRSAATIISGMAAGLSHAHKQGIVHLDFKPSNVFILPSGEVKIFDFGLARGLSAETDAGSVVLGGITPAYASPQALAGEPPGVVDDVFSFAVTVYELLSGQHPYGRNQRRLEHDVAPRRLNGLTRRQWTALRAGLEWRAERRAKSVAAIADAFRASAPVVDVDHLVAKVRGWLRALKPTPTTISVAAEPPVGRMWVADRPIHAPDEDDLQYIDYAKALFGVIDHPKTAPPLTIAINGAFGIGKSSVALLTQYLLASKLEDRGEKRHVTAWMLVGRYRGSSSLRTSFVRDFVRDLYYAQSFWFRARNHLPHTFLLKGEVRRRRLVYIALLFAIGAATSLLAQNHIDTLAQFTDYSSVVGLMASSLAALVLWTGTMLGPLKSLADYVDPEYDSANATYHSEARKQIESMIEKITRGGRRFVLFVDDLERSPERTLEVLDILESLFSMPRCVVVMPTDLDVLGEALERHANVGDGRKYLEKYVQLQFDMPSVENARLLELLMRGQRDEAAALPDSVAAPEPELGSETIAGARDRIDARIRQDGVTQFVVNSELVVPANRWAQLVDERRQRALPDTEIYQTALRYAVSLAGRDVRAAKRISNHVRLYVFVLFHRGLLNSKSTLTALHVGRWIALKELWPEVMSLVNRSPDVYTMLDLWAQDAGAEETVTMLTRIAGQVGSLRGSDLVSLITTWPPSRTESLRNFLKAEPRLTTVVEQLSYLRQSTA
jgi:predicted Ser/Thr protein kinase